MDKLITLQHIYIYPVGMRGGPDLIKNVAAREPAKSCEGARGESRRPKRYKNRGFETSRKMSKKVSFRRSGRPDMSENGEKTAFSDSLRAPSQLFVLRVFSGFGGPVAERKSRKRFVSAGFASAGVFGQPLFLSKNQKSKKVRKMFGSKKPVRN